MPPAFRERATDFSRARGYYLEAAKQRNARNAYAEAETLYRAALSLYPVPEPESVDAHIELGAVVLCRLGRNAEAQLDLRAAIREAESIGDRARTVMGLGRLGYLQCLAGHYAESEAVCLAALELARALPDEALEDKIRITLALTFKCRERFEEAEALYVEVAARSPGLRFEAIRHLSDVLRSQGRPTEALAWCEKALAEVRATGRVYHEGLVLGAMATVCYVLGSVDEARKLSARALDIGREQGDSYMMTTNLINLATVLHEQERSEEAREHYEQAVELGSRLGFRSVVPVALLNQGILLEQTGQIEEASAALEKALGLAREGGMKRIESAALVAMASVERRSGAVDLALGRLDQARALFPEQDQAVVEVQVQVQHLRERGHLALAAGLQAAASHLQEARGVADRLHGSRQPQVQRSFKRLEDALEAFAAGSPLHRGERWEDVPSGLQSWLIRHGKVQPEFSGHAPGSEGSRSR